MQTAPVSHSGDAADEAAGGDGAMHIYRIDPATRQLRHLEDVPKFVPLQRITALFG
ncbi:hypothetical protein ACFXKW_25055 [Streptomyces sp. NPDC059193]|uniref:hypothetical protein n=1 Tax=Streptomyces sp. NPDC059193 TaxID=3346763 RepID=UPI0036CD1399